MKRSTVLISAIFLAFLSFGTAYADSSFSLEEKAALDKQFRIITEILYYTGKYALERPKDVASCVQEMMAMRRLGKCRDRFSYYLPPEETQSHDEDVIGGEFGGIGLEITNRDGRVVVVAPRKGLPAYRAGIKSEDVILEVDGKEVNDFNEAVRLIRGPEGQDVKIKIGRQGQKEPLVFVIKREKIILHPVKSEVVVSENQKIGIVEVSAFDANTPEKFKESVDALKKQGIKKVVIDLRNNPGGLLTSALQMLAYFMRQEDLVITYRERNYQELYDYAYLSDGDRMFKEFGIRFKDFGTLRGLEVAVLINKGSASASEIFAGTMKDWGYTVVGEKSFGKGTGQTRFELSDGSYFFLTTFEFLVGNNKVPIRDKGISPNIEIKASEDGKEDLQLKKAIEVLVGIQ